VKGPSTHARRVLLGLACAVLMQSAHAAMYRCPAPHGEGSVITNLMRESDANERDCEPLQARRSSIDVQQRPAAAGQKNRTASTGDRFTDDWVSSAPKASPNTSKTPTRATVAVSSPDLKPVDPGRADPERRISREAQRERDTDSRKIIQTELSKSQNMVDELRKQVAVLASGTPEHQRLQASLGRHTVDVDSLKSELARMR
jgi:hypothetical protein